MSNTFLIFYQIIYTLLALILVLGLFTGLIFLQKYICKNLNIKFGLILPIIHLIPLILIFVNIAGFGILYLVDKDNISSTTSSINNSSVILNLDTSAFILGSIVQIMYIIFVFIIPALVYYLIYRHYKKKRNQLQNNQKINTQN